MLKTIYHYDRQTGLYLGAGQADPDPQQEDEFLIPAFATVEPPPEPPEGQRAVFDIEADAWVFVAGPLPGEPLPPPPPTLEQRIQLLQAGVQHFLDLQAQALGYDSIFTAVTYADEPAVPKFQAEGLALRAWRSLVWEACYGLLDAFQAAIAAGEEVPEPTLEEVIAQLPAFVAPEVLA